MFATDMVSAGRVHHGKEIFKFHAMNSSFEVMIDGETQVLDKMLVGSPEEVADLERLWNGARHAALVFAYAPDLPEDAEDRVREHCSGIDQTECGVTRIGSLVCARILSVETWQAHEAIFKAWTALRPSISGKTARPIKKC